MSTTDKNRKNPVFSSADDANFLLYSLPKSKDTYFLSSDHNITTDSKFTTKKTSRRFTWNRTQRNTNNNKIERKTKRKHLARISVNFFLCDEPNIVYDNGNRFSLLFYFIFSVFFFISKTEQKILHKFALWWVKIMEWGDDGGFIY